MKTTLQEDKLPKVKFIKWYQKDFCKKTNKKQIHWKKLTELDNDSKNWNRAF